MGAPPAAASGPLGWLHSGCQSDSNEEQSLMVSILVANETAGISVACVTRHPTVTLLDLPLGLWFRHGAMRLDLGADQVSLNRKPRNLARLWRWRCAPQERNRHSTVTLLARLRGLSTSVPLAQAVW